MTLEEANAQLAQNLRAHCKVRRNNRKVRRNNQDRQTDRQTEDRNENKSNPSFFYLFFSRYARFASGKK